MRLSGGRALPLHVVRLQSRRRAGSCPLISLSSATVTGTFAKVQFPIIKVAFHCQPKVADAGAIDECSRRACIDHQCALPLIHDGRYEQMVSQSPLQGEPPKPSCSKNVLSAAGGADPAAWLSSVGKQTIAVTTSPRGNFFTVFFSPIRNADPTRMSRATGMDRHPLWRRRLLAAAIYRVFRAGVG